MLIGYHPRGWLYRDLSFGLFLNWGLLLFWKNIKPMSKNNPANRIVKWKKVQGEAGWNFCSTLERSPSHFIPLLIHSISLSARLFLDMSLVLFQKCSRTIPCSEIARVTGHWCSGRIVRSASPFLPFPLPVRVLLGLKEETELLTISLQFQDSANRKQWIEWQSC